MLIPLILSLYLYLLDFVESKDLYPKFDNNMKRLLPALEYAERKFLHAHSVLVVIFLRILLPDRPLILLQKDFLLND